jgi:hypothetical protein
MPLWERTPLIPADEIELGRATRILRWAAGRRGMDRDAASKEIRDRLAAGDLTYCIRSPDRTPDPLPKPPAAYWRTRQADRTQIKLDRSWNGERRTVTPTALSRSSGPMSRGC